MHLGGKTASVGLATAPMTTFPCFRRDRQEGNGRISLSVFIKPELSGGHHCDDNQTVTKQTKPIKARRTEPGSLYCPANLDQGQEAAARIKALCGRPSTSPPSTTSIFLSHHIFIRGGGRGGTKCSQDRPGIYWLLAVLSGRRASRWTTRGPPPGPAPASPPPGGMALFGSGELLGAALEREKREGR